MGFAAESTNNAKFSGLILACYFIFSCTLLINTRKTLAFVVQCDSGPFLIGASPIHHDNGTNEKNVFNSCKRYLSAKTILWASKISNTGGELCCYTDTPKKRREVLARVLMAGFMVHTLDSSNTVAFAATTPSSIEKADKENLIKGYQRLSYLLQNWDKETTVCGKKNDGIVWEECDRSPEKVMEYLGFKSMKDPLFKADKAIKRLQALVSEENDDEYQEAYQSWIQHSEEGKDMAYVSSWGEANPGGGLDVKAAYIERSRKEVEEAQRSLATIIRLLGMKVD